jgi:phosphoglycolate phosphatase-like HAD superfamily hydrolase
MAVEDLDETNRRLAALIAANRDAIEIVKPLEKAFEGGEEPVQGMIAGSIARMRAAQAALEASPLAPLCSSNRTEYPARDLCILDLMPAGVSKGAALRELCSGLGIERGETMAIGDNWNDLDMLEWAGQAVLMGNAAAGLRTRARLEGWKIAPANVDDGVAVILEKMLERKREKESGQ